MRFVVTLAVVGLFAAVTAAPAQSSLFFLFEPAAATPGETVLVRAAGTARDFTRSDGRRPFSGIRLYLAANDTAEQIRSRFDRRLHFVGRLQLDADARGALRFTVPPLDPGSYTVAAWCPVCAQFSRGRTFFVGPLKAKTVPRWSGFAPDRPIGFRRDRPGSDAPIFDKLIWWSVVMQGALTMRAERLDALAPPARWKANEGGFLGSTFPGRTWATPLWFASAGCWRLTARVGDVSLSVVVRVQEPA